MARARPPAEHTPPAAGRPGHVGWQAFPATDVASRCAAARGSQCDRDLAGGVRGVTPCPTGTPDLRCTAGSTAPVAARPSRQRPPSLAGGPSTAHCSRPRHQWACPAISGHGRHFGGMTEAHRSSGSGSVNCAIEQAPTQREANRQVRRRSGSREALRCPAPGCRAFQGVELTCELRALGRRPHDHRPLRGECRGVRRGGSPTRSGSSHARRSAGLAATPPTP